VSNLSASYQPQERLHALDAIRCIALLLGVVLHATMSFTPGLTQFGFPIIDEYQTEVLGLTFFVIHIFRMATFFLIAGFFAHLVFHRKGARVFLADRRRRILYPLLIWWFPVMIALMVPMIWGLLKQGLNPEEVEPPPPPYESLLPFHLTHLWFLYLLLWLYGLSIAGRYLLTKMQNADSIKQGVDVVLAKTLQSFLAPFILAIPIAILLALIPEWHWWAGIPTPDYSLDPNPYSLAIYLYIFGLGWILDRQRHLLKIVQQRWVLNMVIGLVACLSCLLIAGWRSAALQDVAYTPMVYPYAAIYSIATLSLTLSFVGAGMAFFSKENKVMRYLADASYWIYVWHLPLVFFFAVMLMDVHLHWIVKFPVILILTLIPLVITYDLFVRSTFLGKMMNGKRMQRALFFRDEPPTRKESPA
jgi:glucan biosynthesis protein C